MFLFYSLECIFKTIYPMSVTCSQLVNLYWLFVINDSRGQLWKSNWVETCIRAFVTKFLSEEKIMCIVLNYLCFFFFHTDH